MKKLLTALFLISALMVNAQAVQFDTTDVEALREVVFRKSPKGLSKADEVLFKSMDSQLSKKVAINLSTVPTKYLYDYAERLFFQYQQYKSNEAGAKRFIKIMKKIKETDPNFSGVPSDSYQLKYQIETIKTDIK